MWSPWTGPGLEHLRLLQQQEDIVADGLILGVEEQIPFRLRFESLVNGGSSFTAELPVDGDGLVVDYPELFRRIGT